MSSAAAPTSWSLFSSPSGASSSANSHQIPVWLETDLEPDDILAISLLTRNPHIRVHTIVVGEGTNVEMKMKRMRGYVRDGILGGGAQSTPPHYIMGLPSHKAYASEGEEFMEDDDTSDRAKKKSTLEEFAAEIDGTYRQEDVLTNYQTAMTRFLDSSPQGGLLLLLKPFRELFLTFSSIKQHPAWSRQRIAMYGGFNTRCIFDMMKEREKDAAAASSSSSAASSSSIHSQTSSTLLALFHSVHQTLIFESFHAFNGGSSSMDPTSMPRLYQHCFHSQEANNSKVIQRLKRLISSWNRKMHKECSEYVTNIDQLKSQSKQLAAHQLSKYQRCNRILSAMKDHLDTQLVCADHGLVLVMLNEDVFNPYLKQVELEFDDVGQTKIVKKEENGNNTKTSSTTSNISMVLGLSLQSLDKLWTTDGLAATTPTPSARL